MDVSFDEHKGLPSAIALGAGGTQNKAIKDVQEAMIQEIASRCMLTMEGGERSETHSSSIVEDLFHGSSSYFETAECRRTTASYFSQVSLTSEEEEAYRKVVLSSLVSAYDFTLIDLLGIQVHFALATLVEEQLFSQKLLNTFCRTWLIAQMQQTDFENLDADGLNRSTMPGIQDMQKIIQEINKKVTIESIKKQGTYFSSAINGIKMLINIYKPNDSKCPFLFDVVCGKIPQLLVYIPPEKEDPKEGSPKDVVISNSCYSHR